MRHLRTPVPRKYAGLAGLGATYRFLPLQPLQRHHPESNHAWLQDRPCRCRHRGRVQCARLRTSVQIVYRPARTRGGGPVAGRVAWRRGPVGPGFLNAGGEAPQYSNAVITHSLSLTTPFHHIHLQFPRIMWGCDASDKATHRCHPVFVAGFYRWSIPHASLLPSPAHFCSIMPPQCCRGWRHVPYCADLTRVKFRKLV